VQVTDTPLIIACVHTTECSAQRWNRVWTFDPWPDPVTECMCYGLRDYSDDDVLLMNAFYQKSLVYAAHIQITKIPNIIVNVLIIEK